MERWPRISIVTPSFNQGEYIAETIESVIAQDYPNLEHIVMDGGSTDSTLEVLKRYPHLKVISEPDRGQSDAINKGFRLATGDIWGFLNSDDTLLPGALHRVAQEIDPDRGRHIVMGRCRFIDEHSRFIGLEHPSHFENHRRVLEVWKGHMIPQPAVFWTPEVWQRCGATDENLKYHMDYDLFCRFSREYRFHFVDQVFATYRLHAESKTEEWTAADRIEDGIRLSRRYWGSPLSLMYWQLTLSLAWYRFNRVGRAWDWLRQAQEAWRQRKVLRMVPYALAGGMLAPKVALYLATPPSLRERAQGILAKVRKRSVKVQEESSQTEVCLDHTEPWKDGWVGPRMFVSREARLGANGVRIEGWANLVYMSEPLALTICLDGEEIGQQPIKYSGDFRLELPLSQPLSPGLHTIEVQASTWFVPHRFIRNWDFRPLAWRMTGLEFE